MTFMFATCERGRALRFLQHEHPDLDLQDAQDSAGPLLDLVEADVIRVQDPQYHQPCAVVPGTHWDESRRQEVIEICTRLLCRTAGGDQ